MSVEYRFEKTSLSTPYLTFDVFPYPFVLLLFQCIIGTKSQKRKNINQKVQNYESKRLLYTRPLSLILQNCIIRTLSSPSSALLLISVHRSKTQTKVSCRLQSFDVVPLAQIISILNASLDPSPLESSSSSLFRCFFSFFILFFHS